MFIVQFCLLTTAKWKLIAHLFYEGNVFTSALLLSFSLEGKVIHPKYSKHLPYTVAHTIDCVCSKILNHVINHGLFLSHFSSFLDENTF